MSDSTMNKTIRRKKRRKRIRKLIIWLVILLLGAGAVYLFVIPKLKAETTITYESYTATRGAISNSMSFSGSIDVINDETLSAESAGTVRVIYVEVNEKVSTGDRLMRLSNGEILKASFDGEVNEIYVEEGDEVSANTELIEIVDFENLQVSIRVDEYSVVEVSAGLACNVTVTALEQTFESVITHINRIPSGGSSTSYYTVTAEFSGSEQVLPGMQVTVVIPEEEADDAVIINSDALSFGVSNNAYVLVQNEDGDMEQVYVETGVDNDNYIQIISGIDEGQTVYKAVETTEEASGLASLFSSLTGGSATGGGTMPSGMSGDFDMSDMQTRTFDTTNFGGGDFGGGGGMP